LFASAPAYTENIFEAVIKRCDGYSKCLY